MQITVTFDYPDELIAEHGAKDAADTVAVRLSELYPGDGGGEPLVPDRVEVVIGQHFYEYGVAG